MNRRGSMSRPPFAHMLSALVALALFVSLAAPARAQQQVSPCTTLAQNTTTLQYNCVPVTSAAPLPVVVGPSGASAMVAIGTGSTGAVTATLSAATNKTTFMCGFDVSAIGGTAPVGPVTVGPVVGGGSFTYQLSATASGNTLSRTFTPCIPGPATNTGITVTTTADGSATAVDVNVSGYVQ